MKYFIIAILAMCFTISSAQTEFGFFVRYDYDIKNSEFQFNNCTEGITATIPMGKKVIFTPSVGYRFSNFRYYGLFRPTYPYYYRFDDYESRQLSLEAQLQYLITVKGRFVIYGVAGIKSNISLYEEQYSPYVGLIKVRDFAYYKNSIALAGISANYRNDRLRLSLVPSCGIKILESDKYIKDPFKCQVGMNLRVTYSLKSSND